MSNLNELGKKELYFLVENEFIIPKTKNTHSFSFYVNLYSDMRYMVQSHWFKCIKREWKSFEKLDFFAQRPESRDRENYSLRTPTNRRI